MFHSFSRLHEATPEHEPERALQPERPDHPFHYTAGQIPDCKSDPAPGGIAFSLPLDVLSYRTSGIASLAYSLGGSMIVSLVGLILSLFFGLSNYLLLDNPQMGAIESMKISCRLMKGNKGRYFYISLSFLPLYIACIFTCYIGLLWLEPYMADTRAHFYMDITGELDAPSPQEEPPVQEQPINSPM